MKSAVLAVISLVFAAACATRPATQPLHYTIGNELLQFEHNGAMYVVTDASTIARATAIDAELVRNSRDLKNASEPRSESGEIYDSNMKAGRSVYGIPPADASPADASIRPGYDPLENASDRASSGTYLRRLKDDVTHAQQQMRKLFDDAVIAGVAQRVG